MVYVLDKNGQPLMPTSRYGKVRRLLRAGRAVVVRRTPFTIHLLYETTSFVQNVTLGIDAGSKTVGLSTTTKDKVLYEEKLTLRNDIVNLLSTRREARRTRRSRKCRHRVVRFDNRRKPDGWLAPSISEKVESHISAVKRTSEILPVKSIVIEVMQFDLQWIKNPGLTGTDYQHGEQFGFWNVREYVLARDGHKCQHCKGKSKDPVLNVHHIESRKTGSNSPSNLVTLCETCHKAYHAGKIELKLKRSSQSLRDAAFMNIMRWTVYNKLKALYENVHLTYGYKTKCTRIENGLSKDRLTDARCISGNPKAISDGTVYLSRKIASHTRSLHVFNMKKGGHRRKAIASHTIGSSQFQRYDQVEWDGVQAFVYGSTNGRPILRDINSKLSTTTASVNIKMIKFLNRQRNGIIIQESKNQIIVN